MVLESCGKVLDFFLMYIRELCVTLWTLDTWSKLQMEILVHSYLLLHYPTSEILRFR